MMAPRVATVTGVEVPDTAPMPASIERLVASCTVQLRAVELPAVTMPRAGEKELMTGLGVTAMRVWEGTSRSLVTRTSRVAGPVAGMVKVTALVPVPEVMAPPVIIQTKATWVWAGTEAVRPAWARAAPRGAVTEAMGRMGVRPSWGSICSAAEVAPAWARPPTRRIWPFCRSVAVCPARAVVSKAAGPKAAVEGSKISLAWTGLPEASMPPATMTFPLAMRVAVRPSRA